MKNSQNAAQHSVGPWNSVSHNWHETSVDDADGLRVCKLDTEDWGVDEETEEEFGQKQEANARLIAAAPDLLAALTRVMSWIDNWSPNFTEDDEWPEDRDAALAAIAKAVAE